MRIDELMWDGYHPIGCTLEWTSCQFVDSLSPKKTNQKSHSCHFIERKKSGPLQWLLTHFIGCRISFSYLCFSPIFFLQLIPHFHWHDTYLSKLIVLTRRNIVNQIKLGFKSNQTPNFWEVFGNKRFINLKHYFQNHNKKNSQTKTKGSIQNQKLNKTNVNMDSSLMEPTFHMGK